MRVLHSDSTCCTRSLRRTRQSPILTKRDGCCVYVHFCSCGTKSWPTSPSDTPSNVYSNTIAASAAKWVSSRRPYPIARHAIYDVIYGVIYKHLNSHFLRSIPRRAELGHRMDHRPANGIQLEKDDHQLVRGSRRIPQHVCPQIRVRFACYLSIRTTLSCCCCCLIMYAWVAKVASSLSWSKFLSFNEEEEINGNSWIQRAKV